MALLELPPELVHVVLGFLDGRSLARASAACRQLRELAGDDGLWRAVCERATSPGLLRKDLAPSFRELYARLYAPRGPVDRLVCLMRTGIVVVSPERREDGRARDDGVVLNLRTPDRLQVQQPTWSPDGRWLAFSEFDASLDFSRIDASRVVVVDARTGRRLLVAFTPFPPFYFYWSPCGTVLTFLSNWRDRRVGMRAVDVGRAAARSAETEVGACETVMVGRPLFYSFAPDRFALATHSGGQLAAHTFDPAQRRLLESIDVPLPSAFHGAPQWMPDGRSALAAVECLGSVGPPTRVLALLDPADGSIRRRLLRLACNSSFAANAGGSHVACGLQGPGGAPGALYVLPLGLPEGPERPLEASPGLLAAFGPPPVPVAEAAEAFFWSPDGRLLLFLEPVGRAEEDGEASEPLLCRWGVYDVGAGRARGGFPPFVPSRTLSSHYLPFFDQVRVPPNPVPPNAPQYAQSARLWAPDARAFCYAGADPATGRTGAWVRAPRAAASPRPRRQVQAVGPGAGEAPPAPALAMAGAELALWSPA